MMKQFSIAWVVWVGLAGLVTERATGADQLDYARDVRRILSDKCFKCHGPDPKTQKAGLRLDLREAAVAETKSGVKPIVPGNPDESELVRRILSDDEDEVMPPASAKNPLTEEQKQILKRWVAEGAEYKPHWAYIAPQRPALPAVQPVRKAGGPANWARNAIDYFVLAKLQEKGMAPSGEADRYTLARRAYLDLVGMPPTAEQADAFVNDTSPDAYERMVDRLLDSPAYGERWARPWLDLARYADTNGYEKDRPRVMWPYRDWVIGAINADMPYDRFTIEQIAGDMLPGATQDQVIASGFHRNTMLNEEGGIDPQEFRFYSLVDRVATTGTVWLGLTVGCSQCHTHKYDPLMHDEFYGMMAFFNQADEVKQQVKDAAITAQREQVEAKVAVMKSELASKFPVPGDVKWAAPEVKAAHAQSATLSVTGDGAVLSAGTRAATDTYTLVLETNEPRVETIRLELLADASLPHRGPGRADNGNFVLSEFKALVAPRDGSSEPREIKFARAEADFSQDQYPVAHAIDGNTGTGWAIAGPNPLNVNRTAQFHLAEPLEAPAGIRVTVTLDQQLNQHLLGKFRISFGRKEADDRPIEVRRREHLDKQFTAWLHDAEARAVNWEVVRPVEMKTDLSYLDLLEDGSVLASGDQTKLDIYELKYPVKLKGVTAMRLEAIPDSSLPEGGPGRIYYEGPLGDFYLSQMLVQADGKPVKFAGAAQSFASGANTAAGAIDDKTETGWSIAGQQGRLHTAVFTLAEPLENARELGVRMVFERYYAAGLGRFRIAVTSDPVLRLAADLPPEVEAALMIPEGQRNEAQRTLLMEHYLGVAPELAAARQEIEKLIASMPQYPTTLVMRQRDPRRGRETHLYHRGEYLQKRDPVPARVPRVLHPLPEGAPQDRLSLARWLVDPKNPLVGRVTMNRHWASFFGLGIVPSTEDFGVQSELPVHQQLLDWLATEFVRRNGSVKQMHKLIVTSATYRQSSAADEKLLALDPQNRLMARGPRFRLEAELVRDSALAYSGLITQKLGGPSVFPPQPKGITESAYGPLAWNVATDADRYRRGLYTFQKRTAPYAMFSLFGAPSGETCEARRVRANTPLQALTLLNDEAFVEMAKALGEKVHRDAYDSDKARAVALFRAVVTRPPLDQELQAILAFYSAQAERFEQESSLAQQIVTPGADQSARAAWVATARAVMNLDEAITKP